MLKCLKLLINYWNLTIFSSLFQGEQGLVFKDLLRDLEQNIDPNVVFPWFHRVLTKDEAVKMLVRGELTFFWEIAFIHEIVLVISVHIY